MLRLILFAFIAFFILTGTNFGKSLMAEHQFFEEDKLLPEKWIGNGTVEEQNLHRTSVPQPKLTPDPTVEEAPIKEQDDPTLSKDDAITKVLNEFSLTELLAYVEQVKSGITAEDLAEIKETVKDRFSTEDYETLKQIGKNEFNKIFGPSED
ncbi:hypothetical protein [Alkalihalobacterium alkalinitrilicum]|uniref:hypothetical protein n=1 Tax=Alkalihalobacterium alkalinitrilicum TaxID=427920 RepID=UPI000994AF8B|nr:hypothetical protein [Alkalihalobacterium alkalinitrilicum]